jgi:hypothetical protein
MRNEIKTGDLILFRGTRLLSGVIEALSDSPYSHIAILAWWRNRVVAFQADLRGVEILPASKLVCKYTGRVDWWALRPSLRQGTFRDQLFFDSAITLLGLRYAYFKLIRLAFRILLGRTLRPSDAHATPDSLFCSEFVSLCYRKASADVIDVNPNAGDESTSPGNFATSGYFEPRYQLFDGSGRQACENLLDLPAGIALTSGKDRRSVRPWNGTERVA